MAEGGEKKNKKCFSRALFIVFIKRSGSMGPFFSDRVMFSIVFFFSHVINRSYYSLISLAPISGSLCEIRPLSLEIDSPSDFIIRLVTRSVYTYDAHGKQINLSVREIENGKLSSPS